MSKKIKLTYFKGVSGKYYSTGEYETSHDYFYDVVDEVFEMRVFSRLPGLVQGLNNNYCGFTVLIEGEDFPPHLLYNNQNDE